MREKLLKIVARCLRLKPNSVSTAVAIAPTTQLALPAPDVLPEGEYATYLSARDLFPLIFQRVHRLRWRPAIPFRDEVVAGRYDADFLGYTIRITQSHCWIYHYQREIAQFYVSGGLTLFWETARNIAEQSHIQALAVHLTEYAPAHIED